MPTRMIIEFEVIWHGAADKVWGKGSLLDAYHPSGVDPHWSQIQATLDPKNIDTRALRCALARIRRPGGRHPWQRYPTPDPRGDMAKKKKGC